MLSFGCSGNFYFNLCFCFSQNENDCCDLPVAELSITMLLRRRTYYYVMSLILPCTLIACTIFLEFILPAESGERVGLGITILLSMAVFQELTSEKLPSSSEHFPLLGKRHLGIKTSFYFNTRVRTARQAKISKLLLQVAVKFIGGFSASSQPIAV